MMKAVIDTNILVDALMRREPFDEVARKFLVFGALQEYELWMGLSQITDLFYILSHKGKPAYADDAKKKLKILRKHVQIVGVGEGEIDAALSSTWADIEDACVYQTALKLRADCIITRDKDGFAHSSIPVFTAEEFFVHLEKEHGLQYEELAV